MSARQSTPLRSSDTAAAQDLTRQRGCGIIILQISVDPVLEPENPSIQDTLYVLLIITIFWSVMIVIKM